MSDELRTEAHAWYRAQVERGVTLPTLEEAYIAGSRSREPEIEKLREDRCNLLDSMLERFREWRGLDIGETCSRCDGAGRKCYPDTSTWHGGAGGQMITYDVCNKCWGSGDEKRPWKSWRVP